MGLSTSISVLKKSSHFSSVRITRDQTLFLPLNLHATKLANREKISPTQQRAFNNYVMAIKRAPNRLPSDESLPNPNPLTSTYDRVLEVLKEAEENRGGLPQDTFLS